LIDFIRESTSGAIVPDGHDGSSDSLVPERREDAQVTENGHTVDASPVEVSVGVQKSDYSVFTHTHEDIEDDSAVASGAQDDARLFWMGRWHAHGPFPLSDG
jgi:hypothetical protein